MEHWGMSTMSKKVSMLALASIFTVGISACGGGGGGSSSSSSSGTVAGIAVEGPVTSGSVKVYNADGSQCSSAATTTNSTATFTLNLGACTLPVVVELSGGTDTVHSGAGLAVPQTLMRSIVGSSTQSVANISPLSTLIYHSLIKDSASLSAAGVTTSNAADSLATKSTTVINAFGFGADLLTDGTSVTSFNPITAPMAGTNLASFIQANEALSETIRLVAKAAGGVSSTNIGEILRVLGRDLSDDSLDGNMGSTAITSGISGFSTDNIRAYAQANTLFVLNQIFSTTGLTITGTDGTQKSALSAIKTAISTVNSKATATFDSMKASSNVVAQWASAKATALALFGATSLADFGISSDISTSASVSGRGGLTVSSTAAANAADKDKVASYSANVSKANKAYTTASTFNVSLGSITLTDYPNNTANTVAVSTPAISSGALTLSLPSTSPLSASNLSLLASSATSSQATPPVVNFALANLPTGGGIAGVTMTLLDGSDGTRSVGERMVSASFNLPWTSNGTSLTLSDATAASVSYYESSSTSPASATLSQSSVGSLIVTAAGSNQSSQASSLKLQIAQLFNTASKSGNAALAAAMTSAVSTGSYYYSIDFSGISLAGTDSKSNTSTFNKVQGTFTAK